MYFSPYSGRGWKLSRLFSVFSKEPALDPLPATTDEFDAALDLPLPQLFRYILNISWFAIFFIFLKSNNLKS